MCLFQIWFPRCVCPGVGSPHSSCWLQTTLSSWSLGLPRGCSAASHLELTMTLAEITIIPTSTSPLPSLWLCCFLWQPLAFSLWHHQWHASFSVSLTPSLFWSLHIPLAQPSAFILKGLPSFNDSKSTCCWKFATFRKTGKEKKTCLWSEPPRDPCTFFIFAGSGGSCDFSHVTSCNLLPGLLWLWTLSVSPV